MVPAVLMAGVETRTERQSETAAEVEAAVTITGQVGLEVAAA